MIAERIMVNGRWPLMLPPHRAARPEWPWWEAGRLAAMSHVIRSGMHVVDVGAEEGDFPALFASWGATVTLIEPNPHVWPCIRYTWEANDLPAPAGMHVVLCGDTATDAAEPDAGGTGPDGWPQCSRWPMVPDHGFRHLWEHGGTNTPVTTLDCLSLAPDVLTMDVEGGELAVLRGATRTLREHRPTVFVSIHAEFLADLYGQHPDEVLALMESLGYTATYLCSDHEAHWMFTP